MRTGLLALCLTVSLLFTGCGGGGGEEPGPDVQALLTQAWTSFTAGDFAAAKAKFQEALAIDPALLEGTLGVGWSSAFLVDLTAAEAALAGVAATPVTAANAEFVRAAQAGLAVVRLALDDNADAVAAGLALLAADPDWAFEFRASVNADDVRLAVAEASVAQGDFVQAQAQLDALDPDNGLVWDVPGSWVVGGVSYDTYETAVVQALMAVEAEIGEDSLF